MGRSNKSAWLEGPGDLDEADVVVDIPEKGDTVRVRGLPAAYSNQAISEALESKQVGRDSISTVNKGRLEILQFANGVIDPVFSTAEAELVAQKYGPTFRRVIDKIDELSAVDKEAVSEATARFSERREDASGPDVDNGTGPRDGRSTLPPRAGARAKDASGGNV